MEVLYGGNDNCCSVVVGIQRSYIVRCLVQQTVHDKRSVAIIIIVEPESESKALVYVILAAK